MARCNVKAKRDLEVYHKRRDGVNDISNAEVLCKKCHVDSPPGVAPPAFSLEIKYQALKAVGRQCQCTRLGCCHQYAPHSNAVLQELFRAGPWQGQEPGQADIIFLGLDANYSHDVDINLIRPYHENGVAFWQNHWQEHRVHHPFLLPEYTGDGRIFHQRFARMELDSGFATHLSFYRTSSLPNTGK
ncbi:MAG: hypothetical protein HQK96_19705 [Nitrospirae bacterium]|nr:hypothetical protein [Nitrospirota bacterium]